MPLETQDRSQLGKTMELDRQMKEARGRRGGQLKFNGLKLYTNRIYKARIEARLNFCKNKKFPSSLRSSKSAQIGGLKLLLPK
mmetsp:Transcript_2622/g.1849  ORF Transcript_2622/g.1849 Transcript_2622/m.1849 type:complete len:83 (+) Transcript_2622:54-302(+)